MNINFDDFNFLYIFLDKDGIIKDINKFGCNLLGLPKSKIIGINVFDNFIPDEEKESRILNFKTFFNDVNNIFEKRSILKFITPEKKEIFLEAYSSIAYSEKNEKIGLIGFGFDITEKIKYEQLREKINKVHQLIINSYTLSDNSNIYQFFLEEAVKIIDNADGGSILMKEKDGLFHFVAAVNFDLDNIKKVVLTPKMLLPFDKVTVKKFTKHKYRNIYERNIMLSAGKIQDIKATLTIPIIIDGILEGIINLDSFKNDNAFNEEDIYIGEIISNELSQVIKRKKLEQKLKYLALHDQLTTLPNRVYLYEYAENMLKLAKRKNMKLAFVYIDLKKFKLINDNYGHDVGDHFLYEFADALKNSIRESDFPARIGGDEFILILPDTDESKVLEVIKRLKENLDTPIKYENIDLKIKFNCGVSFFPNHGNDVEQLINISDKTMYKAKKTDKLIEFYRGE
ncbi:diguanylate cyclase domain-containing protein [Marinitoga aeolica]|uniref:Diguanylate cyclase n=1 Tax=Marinitoga aeolica TaxID=2809031 RepID=A0ABY8PT26_9BACT|nr:diguanylate cyclase [Marinitoga aeolica]WGS65793.1 diguanylate cyclase [Marinitoga aeolica]